MITIHQQPPLYSPAYNPMMVVLSSDNVALPNFSYRLLLYIGLPLPIPITLDVKPDPNGLGVFDIHRIMESHVTYDISLPSTGFNKNLSSVKLYAFRVLEVYGTPPVPDFGSIINSINQYVYNASLPYEDYFNYDYTDHVLGTDQRKFLTNSPRSQKYLKLQTPWLHFNLEGVEVTKMTITSYPTLYPPFFVTVFDVPNPFSPITVDEDKFLRFKIGEGVFASNPAKVVVQAFNGVTPVSEEMEFIIDYDCTPYSQETIHFLNVWGGFDTKSFTRLSKRKINVDRKSYSKSIGEVTGTTWGYALQDRGNVVYNTDVRTEYTLNSNWLTDAESVWLQELISSPEQYMLINGNLQAIDTSTSSYDIKQKVNEKLFNITYQFQLSHVDHRQRG